MKQKAKILIFCMIFVGGRAFSQQKADSKLSLWPANFPVKLSFWEMKGQSYYPKPFGDLVSKTKPSAGFSFLPANYYASQLAFFCRQEIKIEKTTRVPFTFRLGSVQQCDWLEGKPNSTYRKW